jgi:hypothetical protein
MTSRADRIRRKINDGRLPMEEPVKVWTGSGSGTRCSGCEEIILPSQVEYDFTSDGQEFRFHLGCYGLWEAECRRRGWWMKKPA